MKTLNILIVDDDVFIGSLLEGQLKSRGFRNCSTVQTGKECIRVLDKTDLILLDYYLEFENGMDVLRDIKRLKPNLPVIFLSGQEFVSVAIQSIKLGAYDYVEKSELNYAALIELIESAANTAYPLKSNSRFQHFLMSLGLF